MHIVAFVASVASIRAFCLVGFFLTHNFETGLAEIGAINSIPLTAPQIHQVLV